MQTNRRVRHGFTLVELLTVIAIIGILAGLTAAGLSQAIHRARMTEMYNRMGNVEDLLYIYYTEHGTFPPGYGYVHPDIRDTVVDCGLDGDPTNDTIPRENPDNCLNETEVDPVDGDDIANNHFFLGSYMALLEQANNQDLYDPWSASYDTDGDSTITYLEYLPPRDENPDDADILYEDGTLGPHTHDPELNQLSAAEHRPFIYIPVNRRQADRVARWYLDNIIPHTQFPNEADNPAPPDPDTHVNEILQDHLATPGEPPLGQVYAEFPPAKYDAFILMSVGPNGTTAGLVRELTNMVDLNNYPVTYRYHVLGHLLFYLLTRDADENGKLDYTYDGRKDLKGSETLYPLPEQLRRNAPGPVVVVSSR